jgi:hypothetical protein
VLCASRFGCLAWFKLHELVAVCADGFETPLQLRGKCEISGGNLKPNVPSAFSFCTSLSSHDPVCLKLLTTVWVFFYLNSNILEFIPES